MSLAVAPRKTEKGWVMDVPDEMAQAMGIATGSIALLYVNNGNIQTELLPPPSDEMKDFFESAYEKYPDAFEEMERLGD